MANRKALAIRAGLLQQFRAFFDQRGFLEVETPLLSTEVIPELHIEPMAMCASTLVESVHYLQASPEADMKRLLAEEAGAIYQVTRSFREGERGPLHRPEFTICEWYRPGDTMHAGIDLVDQLCRQLLGTGPLIRTSYAEAFDRHAGISPHTINCQDLAERAEALGIGIPTGIDRDNRDEWLEWILSKQVEPELGRDAPEVLYDYPSTQAALAKIRLLDDGTLVASRFELYWRGVELANGYHELTCAMELRARLEQVNHQRIEEGRPLLPMPERLLEAMPARFPDSTGCALGFDRLVMLACGAESIDQVMA